MLVASTAASASGLVISESKQSIRSIALAALNSDSAKSGWNSCSAIASRLACSIPHLSTYSIAVLSLPRIRNRGPDRAYTENNHQHHQHHHQQQQQLIAVLRLTGVKQAIQIIVKQVVS